MLLLHFTYSVVVLFKTAAHSALFPGFQKKILKLGLRLGIWLEPLIRQPAAATFPRLPSGAQVGKALKAFIYYNRRIPCRVGRGLFCQITEGRS